MNLLQIRQQFRSMSGRFDLVEEDGSNNGADFYINSGSKFLDRLSENQKSWASCFRFIEAGRFSTQFPYCRAIKEVWAATSDKRWQLEKKSLQDLTAAYLTGLPSSRGTGQPRYYSPTITRYIPEDATADTFEAFAGFVDIPAGTAHEYNCIVLSVPVDQKMMFEIKGLFYSMELVEDTDENYWSVSHSLLLTMAAMRYLEVVNRNTQGVNDWDNAIRIETEQLGYDLVEELIAEADEMGE